jgi:hypothetical protein
MASQAIAQKALLLPFQTTPLLLIMQRNPYINHSFPWDMRLDASH